uniref:Uncharacterized protein n=1 Tax=Arundo donax TaxID=35708 RepID=A0A0A9H634_ARUDO
MSTSASCNTSTSRNISGGQELKIKKLD